MVSWIERQWRGTTPWHFLLVPLSWLFGGLAAARRALYRCGVLPRVHLPVQVIVVGNISAGGTGKTPLVLWLAQQLAARGWQPGIVSRGYGGRARAPQAVDAASDAASVGDEPLLLASAAGCPVWVGRDRPAAGRSLLAAHPEVNVLIADDGLQHYRLARAVEIAVVDGARGFGNGRLLPAGALREPFARLAEVDAIVVNQPGAAQTDLPGAPVYVMHIEGERFINLADPARSACAADFAGDQVHAIAGIGHPQRFFAHIAALGIHAQYHPFPDHHVYCAAELAYPGAILMTSKDAVKCRGFATENMWVLPVRAVLQPGLIEHVLTKIGNYHG